MKLFNSGVYTIVDEARLKDADRGEKVSEPLVENKNWATVRGWLDEAKRQGESIPLILADASHVKRLLGWAELVDVHVAHVGDRKYQSTYRFKNLRPLDGHERSDFTLLSQGRPISEEHIRPYALLQTPRFLQSQAANRKQQPQRGPRSLKQSGRPPTDRSQAAPTKFLFGARIPT